MLRYGYEQYEISNFCKDNLYSKHNSSYWKKECNAHTQIVRTLTPSPFRDQLSAQLSVLQRSETSHDTKHEHLTMTH